MTAAWNGFWFAPASPYPLAAFRILLGTFLVVYFGLLLPDAELLFSAQGVYVPYLIADLAPPALVAVPLFWLTWLLACALLFGYRLAVTLPLLIALYVYHYLLALGVNHSAYERLALIYLLVLWPAGSDAAWSVLPPSAASAKHTAVPSSMQYAPRLLRFQSIALYFGAGLWKLVNPNWATGTLLRCTLQSIWATPLGFRVVRLGFSDDTWTWFSRGVIASELLLAALLSWRRTRVLGVALGLCFHFANVVFLSLPEFLVCVTPYVFFLPEAWFERLARMCARSPRTQP